MRKLDLHGIRHQDVKVLVEDFVYMNQHEFPLEIICGNSEKMIKLVKEALDKHGVDSHMFRYGIIIARNWR
jgi:hypothetical protein